MDKINIMKEVCAYILLAGIPLAWMYSLGLSTWKEYHRHLEISKVIEFLIADKKETAAFAMNAVEKLARQKSLIVLRDEDGGLTVQALDTAEKEDVRKELDRQKKEKSSSEKNN